MVQVSYHGLYGSYTRYIYLSILRLDTHKMENCWSLQIPIQVFKMVEIKNFCDGCKSLPYDKSWWRKDGHLKIYEVNWNKSHISSLKVMFLFDDWICCCTNWGPCLFGSWMWVDDWKSWLEISRVKYLVDF